MKTALTKTSIRCFAVLTVLVATTWLPLSASAVQPKSSPDFKMYLQVEGIIGDVTEPGFEKAIEIVAYSWGASQSGSFAGGGSGVGKPNFQDLSMTKYFDASTPPLLLALAKGTHIPKATLTLVRRVNGIPDRFMVFAATDVLVTSLSTGASASQDSGTLSENITIAFGQAKLTYKNLDGTSSDVTINVAGGTAN